MSGLTGNPIEFISKEVNLTFTVAAGISSGTMFHDLLSNRESNDQHPISSITGLQNELDSKTSGIGFDNVDNTSDIDKPISTLTQEALELKANSIDLNNVDNTSDNNKPISVSQQTALDYKANLTLISNVTNTSDANKPVSIAQQTALDLKVDKSIYYNFFANTSISSFTVVSIEPAYEEVDRMTLVELDAGTYTVQFSGRVQCDTVGRKAFIRWSLNGGATWEDSVAHNIIDVTDKKPFTHVEVITLSAGATTIIVQAAKVTGVGSMIINKLDIVCERKV